MTPARFKQLKPQFQNVDNATVQIYLDLAARVVDDTWTAGDREYATASYACHLMTLDGLGLDPESVSHASGTAEFQVIKSGELSLTRFRKDAGDQTSYTGWLSTTACGRMYLQLLRMNKAGPRIVNISRGCGPSGYAKDWKGPTYGWPGVFNNVC